MRFDHVGLFVSDLEIGRQQLGALLPIREWNNPIHDPGMNIMVQFGVDESGLRYELVAPAGEPNPVSGVLASGHNILNHVGYRCENFEDAMAKLRAARAMPLGRPRPAVAFQGARIMFYLTPLKFVVELIEAI